MKLLFVHERFGALAGAEANLLASASALKQRGHEVALAHGQGTGQGEAAWNETFPERFAFADASDNGATADNAVRSFRPALIYLHKMSDLEVLQALARTTSPVVNMVHDHDLYCMKSYRYHTLTRTVCQRAASPFCVFPCGAVLSRSRGTALPFRWVSYTAKREARRIHQRFQRAVVATQYMRQELVLNGFDASKIEVHAPVPPAADPGVRASFGPRNRLIYSGQITRGKGVDVLLQALAKLQEPFECLVLGDGHHRKHCEALSHKLGLSGRVRFMGFVPQEELKEFYRDGSVAVVSSVWPEPFGAVGLEAMRYGLPVVAFDAGGIKEWLDDGINGFLVPWMNREIFAARVDELLRDKTRARQMGARALATVAERYSFAKYISGLEALFQNVVAEQAHSIPKERTQAVDA